MQADGEADHGDGPPSPQASPSLHRSLANLPAEAIPELTGYFNESWGNKTRIDYGSGMELNFLCWMSVQHCSGRPGSC